MIWATVSSQPCFCWLYRASLSLAAKNISIRFSVDHLVMSMCRVFSCVVGWGCLLWPVHSLGKLYSPLPCFILYSKAKFACYPGVSWLPTCAFQSPLMKRTSFLGVSFKRSWRSSLNSSTSASALLSGHSLGLPWYWMVCLGNEQRSFCRFGDCIQVLHFGLFC